MGAAKGAFVVLVLAVAGCRPVSIVSQPSLPTLTGEGTRCRNAVGQDQPLVTEWPAAEKANLETQIRLGSGVVVSFTGCTMTVLTQCRTKDPYYWVRTTPSSDWIEIRNQDELYAKLPLGAASLAGELQGSGSLTMQTTIAGQFRLGIAPGAMPTIEGDCQGATHVVGGLAIGAYQLAAGGTTTASLEASVHTIGAANATSTASKSIIRRAGEAASCANSTDAAPDASCASPIQMFLMSVQPTGGPGQLAYGRPPPAAGGPIEVQLMSAEPETTWDVVVDGHKVCATPCTQRLDPSRTLLLREQSSILSRTTRVQLPNLRDWAAVGGVQVKAHTTSRWNLAGLSRMGGVFYGVIGAGFAIPCLTSDDDDRGVMCTMSGFTLGFGVGLFALGTWVLDSPGRADTSPLSGQF
ncbi:MAG: hypothetical protein IPH80_06960 [Myxococcales bacterium]|nr:hypothetical protein [Myxococcales bacterium]